MSRKKEPDYLIQPPAQNEDTAFINFLIAEYQVLTNRRVNHNSLLWSIPSLMFVAQTALWGIAFNSCYKPIIRIVISFFSVIVGVAALQCFLRNRLMEIADAEQSYIIERAFREKYGTDIQFPIPTLIINNKLRKRTWFNDSSGWSIAAESEKNLKDFIDSQFRCRLYKMHSSKLWVVVFIISILIPLSCFLYLLVACILHHADDFRSILNIVLSLLST